MSCSLPDPDSVSAVTPQKCQVFPRKQASAGSWEVCMFHLFILCADENLEGSNRVASMFWKHVLDRQVLWKVDAFPKQL